MRDSFWSDSHIHLYAGDVLSVLKEMSDESVHCVVTSPPYWGLRDYGTPGQLGLEATPEEHVERMVAVFREVRRVLRRDGTLWLNYGDTYAAKVPDSKHTDVGNFHGMDVPLGLKPKDLVGMPWRVAFALQSDGWWLRSDIIWSKPNPMPESVTDRPTKAHEYLFLLAKSDHYYYDADAVREAAEYGYSTGTGAKIWARSGVPTEPGRTPGARTIPGSGGSRNKRTVWEIATEPYPEAHFATFPTALVMPPVLASTSERGCCAECGAPWARVTEPSEEYAAVLARLRASSAGSTARRKEAARLGVAFGDKETGRSASYRTSGWTPTCTHEARVVPCTVLDPFSGSGTTVMVAKSLGRHGIGIELSETYLKMSIDRIRGYTADIDLGIPGRKVKIKKPQWEGPTILDLLGADE